MHQEMEASWYLTQPYSLLLPLTLIVPAWFLKGAVSPTDWKPAKMIPVHQGRPARSLTNDPSDSGRFILCAVKLSGTRCPDKSPTLGHSLLFGCFPECMLEDLTLLNAWLPRMLVKASCHCLPGIIKPWPDWHVTAGSYSHRLPKIPCFNLLPSLWAVSWLSMVSRTSRGWDQRICSPTSHWT